MEVTKTFVNLPIAYEFYVRDDLSVTSVKVMRGHSWYDKRDWPERPNIDGVCVPQVRKMLSQLQRAFKRMIEESKWTDRATQLVTSKKVDAIKAEIGYPGIFETPEELEKLYEHVRMCFLVKIPRRLWLLHTIPSEVIKPLVKFVSGHESTSNDKINI